MKYAEKFGLRPADRIVENITGLGISKHHAIYLGRDPTGTEWIVENFMGQGVRLVTAAAHFSRGNLVHRIERFSGTQQQRKCAVQWALQQVGRPYHLIQFNCEHFAEQVQTGRPRNRQVEWVWIGLAVLVIIQLVKTNR
jgi:uncharacterized protein YycO